MRSCSFIRTRSNRSSSPTGSASITCGRSSTISSRNIRTPPRPRCFSPPARSAPSSIRLGHGIALMPPRYNHPARVAERIATLDLVSNGRVEWGTGESATAVEMGGFKIDPQRQGLDVAGGHRAGRQHAGDAALSRLSRALVRHAVPQLRAKAGAEAAPADVGRLLAPRDDPPRRAGRARRAGLRLSRTRAGGEMGRGILRDHQIRGMRADRPYGQSEHRDGQRHVVPPGRGRSDPPRSRWLPLLWLFARLLRAVWRAQARASPICGSDFCR